MKTKILTLSLAIAMLLTLTACGSTDNDSSINNDTTAQASSEQQETEQDSNNDEQETAENDGHNEDNSTINLSEPHGITNLITLGETATSTFENRYGVKENATITLNEIIRGDAALDYINEQMGDGFWTATNPDDESEEYLIAKITYTLNSYEDGDSKEVSSFYAATADGEAYPFLLASMFYNKEEFKQISSQTVAIGETVTAYEIFQVKKDDATPLMYYRCNYADNSDGLWFKLY